MPGPVTLRRLAFLRQTSVPRTKPDQPAVLVVRERANAGEAEVLLEVGDAEWALALDLGHPKKMDILEDRQSCDGSVVLEKDGRFTACVIEIKRTLSIGALKKARDQLRAGAVRLQMVASFLGLDPAAWSGIIVCEKNRTLPDSNPDPALLHRPVGPSGASDSIFGPIRTGLPADVPVRIEQIPPPPAGAGILTGTLAVP
jgi:hypothetical protein